MVVSYTIIWNVSAAQKLQKVGAKNKYEKNNIFIINYVEICVFINRTIIKVGLII